MPLKPHDLAVLFKCLGHGPERWTYAAFAEALSLSASEVHGATGRLLASGLLRRLPEAIAPDRPACEEFILYGAPHCFYPQRGGPVRGIPTAFSAVRVSGLQADRSLPPPVWPHAYGRVKGNEFSPLYPGAPQAALKDPGLYRMLALFDALRGGQSRERALAGRLMSEQIRFRPAHRVRA